MAKMQEFFWCLNHADESGETESNHLDCEPHNQNNGLSNTQKTCNMKQVNMKQLK